MGAAPLKGRRDAAGVRSVPARGSRLAESVGRCEPSVALVHVAEDGPVGGRGDRGDLVDEIVGWSCPERRPAVHQPPCVPREELHLVQRREVTNYVAAHEPGAPPLLGAELLRVGLPGPEEPPGFAAGQEPAGGDGERIEVQPALAHRQIGVDSYPAGACGPDFNDPVVAKLALLELRGMATSRPNWDATTTQHGAGHDGEVPTVHNQPPLRWSRNI